MKCTIMSSALTFVLLGTVCAQTTVNQPTAVEQPLSTSESGVGNSVAGTLTVNGEVFKMTHAYARRVESRQEKKSNQDVLIVFTNRAVARQVLETSRILQFALGAKAKNDELRGFEVKISEREEQSEDGKVVHRTDLSVGIYHPSLTSIGAYPAGYFINIETVSVTEDLAQGKVSGKSDSQFADFKYEVSFEVSLRPDEWSGIIYKQPPTNLAPGTARGQVLIDGKPVKLNHVYAVQQSAAGDLFGDAGISVRLFFTEKPLPDPEAVLAEKNPDTFQRLRQAGNNYVMYLDITPQTSASDPLVRELQKPDDGSATLVVAETNLILTKFEDKTIDGRIFNDGASIERERASGTDLSFNASVIKSDPVDGPVTATNGQPLPAGGGAPGAAYLAFVKAALTTKNLNELKQLLETSQSAKLSAEVKQSLRTVPAEREEETFRVYQAVLTIKDARVEGGFASADKATLWVTGTEEGKKVTARFNMHLENGQWKVGTGSTRVGE